MKITIVMGILIALPAFASPGFKNGNNLQILQLSGTVNVQCQAALGINTQTYVCNQDVASPSGVDVFTAGNVDADQVVLVATHQDGSQDTKTSSYNPKTGESGQIDLLVDSLFDRPLLAIGMNTISYTLNKGSNLVTQGSFVSTVTNGGVKQCPFGTITAQCADYSGDCDLYFQQYGQACLNSK